jgi:hypothetical protein
MRVKTLNSVYSLHPTVDKRGMRVLTATCESGTLQGTGSHLVVAVYPNRIPAIMAASVVTNEGEYLVGYNELGTRTFKIIPDQVKPGMILFSRSGFRSTEIQKVV